MAFTRWPNMQPRANSRVSLWRQTFKTSTATVGGVCVSCHFVEYCEGGLNEKVALIHKSCKELNTPVIFALSRRSMSRAVGMHGAVSVVGLLTLDDIMPKFKVGPISKLPFCERQTRQTRTHLEHQCRRWLC